MSDSVLYSTTVTNVTFSFISLLFFLDTLALVNKYAPALVNTLLIMLSGHMPAYALDESNGCISDVLWYLRKRLLAEFRVCILIVIAMDFIKGFGLLMLTCTSELDSTASPELESG